MAPSSIFHILAVDDNLVDRTLIEKLLTTSSYQVTVVDSVTKALQFLGFQENEENYQDPQHLPPPPLTQRVQVNLIITDYCMPGMTGFDLLRKIKGSSTLKDLPVVIMSSENNPSRISRCMEEGADDFFLKPVQMTDVNRLMSHLLRITAKNGEEEVVESRKKESKLMWVGSCVANMVWGGMLRRKTQITIFLFSIVFFFCPKWLRFSFA